MTYTVTELARLIGGQIEGDGETLVEGVAGLQEAGPREITFAVAPYLDYLHLAKAAAIVVPSDAKVQTTAALIRVENPRSAFTELSTLFHPEPIREIGVHQGAIVCEGAEIDPTATIMPLAYIGPKAKIGAKSIIYPHVYIGDNVQIDECCIIYAGVVIRENCLIGKRCIIQPGTVIGSDGFGFTLVNGKHRKVPQIGKVILGDDVEVGANATIDRGTLGDTVVGNGTKFDNLVHLAHNVQTGENCLFVAFSGMSGSTIIGDNCTFGGQSATKGHLTIGDNCLFAGRTGITGNVESNSVMSGFPARPHREWLKQEAASHQLPQLLKRVKEMEKQLDSLKPHSTEG